MPSQLVFSKILALKAIFQKRSVTKATAVVWPNVASICENSLAESDICKKASLA